MGNEILSAEYHAAVFAHSAATEAKTFYLINARVLLAMNDADASEENVFVHESPDIRVPKTTGQAWAVGDTIYWDDTNKKFTTSDGAGANTKAGYVVAPALSADTEGEIYLQQFA